MQFESFFRTIRHFSLYIAIVLSVLLICAPGIAQQTPPIEPKIQDTPLPAAVELPSPGNLPSDIPNRPLTADEAARIALRYQPIIGVAQSDVMIARGLQKQARSGLLPLVSISGGFSNTSVLSNELGFTGPQGSEIETSASINQLIFDFNHTHDLLNQTEAQLRSTNANLTRVQADQVLQVKQAFYTYAQNQQLVAVNEANVKNQQNHLALAQARLKAGLGLPADVVRAQTAVSDAIFSLNTAQNVASISRVNLALLMGIDPRTPIQVSDTREPDTSVDDVQAMVNDALRNRPEMRQAEANVNAAQYGLKAAKSTNKPAIFANAGLNGRGNDFPLSSSLGAGISIRWDIFDSGFTAGRVESAKGNLGVTESQFQATQLQVVSDVSQSYLNLKTAEQRVKTADAEVANAEESLRLIQGRYQAGLGTFLDVLDAQTALVTAKTNRINAITAVDQARAALAHAVGKSL
jgi:outer membrane protein TolC